MFPLFLTIAKVAGGVFGAGGAIGVLTGATLQKEFPRATGATIKGMKLAFGLGCKGVGLASRGVGSIFEGIADAMVTQKVHSPLGGLAHPLTQNTKLTCRETARIAAVTL